MASFARTEDWSERTSSLVWALVFGFGLFVVECVYLYCKQGPFFGALGSWTVPLIAAYLGLPLVLALILSGRIAPWRTFAIIAVTLYAVESVKMFVISAPLLGSPLAVGGFVLVSAAMFAVLLFVAKRLSLGPSVLFWFVWVYSASCYAVASQWRSVGGNMAVFLRSPSVLVIVALGAISWVCSLWISRRPRRSLLSAALLLMVSTLTLGALAGSAPSVRGNETISDETLPDIYVASFDALGRDVFERYCRASAGAAARICGRGLHFPNVVADGLATYEILRANTYGDRSSSRCDDSLPGLAAARGYATSMWLGRKGVRIKGADCYGHYFSGLGADMATRFAVPAVAVQVWQSLYTGSVDLREEFIDSRTMLSELNARSLSPGPQFAYLHFLDLHAPYRPGGSAEPDLDKEKTQRFMDSCYRVGCDPAEAEQLIAHAKSSFERLLPDVDRHLAALLEIAETRGRPFVLVVTADHGELFGEYGGFGHTGGFVPELLSVPFVVYDSRTDYRAQRDCALALSSDALRRLLQDALSNEGAIEPGMLLGAASSVAVHDSLGVATVDAASEEIRFRIDDRMVEQANTSRNVHTVQRGSLHYPIARCQEDPTEVGGP
jgi:hypothetical protein